MENYLVGTCSWTDPALRGSGWYPPAARDDPEERLRHYAARFPVVEVDATYYGLPSVRNSRLWADRTPPGFVFDVKAFATLTGHSARAGALPPDLRPPGPPQRRVTPARLPRGAVDELWQRFTGALRPLEEAGRLGAVLLQFPPWVRAGERGHAFLAECRRRAGRLPLAVEFRHPGWLAPGERRRTLDVLRAHGMSLVAVDTAQDVPDAVPPVAAVTRPELAVVRFHGRSAAWGTGSKEDAYRHSYTAEELAPWRDRIRRLAGEAEQVHVLFNNCCGDAAVRSAAVMRELLEA
ncbi:DUF72 domain-containing protein [Streptomyces huiliensis]|uniref:DUF72 domain-containing protein n=1 Tax=Streptomyces huiliensis TaxID=2876027 RepID=UPI001CC074D9|nr:DUF72 domain-containing protein [Streptomyces huiliensis]MBZ4322441.1 DUF72 domain-containing protein [Streptomyces huiliensis]